MRTSLEVHYSNGETIPVVAILPDYTLFEEVFDRSVMRLNTELRLSDMSFLCFASLRRQNKITVDSGLPVLDAWREWEKSVEQVNYTDEDDDLIPLENSQPIGTLPDSQ
jgi:hypothetical protein